MKIRRCRPCINVNKTNNIIRSLGYGNQHSMPFLVHVWEILLQSVQLCQSKHVPKHCVGFVVERNHNKITYWIQLWR